MGSHPTTTGSMTRGLQMAGIALRCGAGSTGLVAYDSADALRGE